MSGLRPAFRGVEIVGGHEKHVPTLPIFPRGHEKHVPTLPAFNPFRQTNMTNSQLNKDNQPSKASHQAGIDVGSEELVMVIRKNNKPFDPQKPV